MFKRLIGVALATLSIGVTTLHAQPTSSAAAAAEVTVALRADTCRLCHGVEGLSVAGDVPNLAGQRKAYLMAQLTAFRDGRRKNELMNAVAAQLAPDEIEALATYWSTRPAAGVAKVEPLPTSATLPVGFPAGFTEYLRTEATDGQTVTIVSANAVALRAARAGRPLADGSVIVSATYALLATKDAQGRRLPGAVRGYAVMEAQAGWGEAVPPLLRNGNWHYALLGADGSPRTGAAHPRCLACHQPLADKSHVFSIEALKAQALR